MVLLTQAALAYARFVDEEKRAEEVDGVLDLKPYPYPYPSPYPSPYPYPYP